MTKRLITHDEISPGKRVKLNQCLVDASQNENEDGLDDKDENESSDESDYNSPPPTRMTRAQTRSHGLSKTKSRISSYKKSSNKSPHKKKVNSQIIMENLEMKELYLVLERKILVAKSSHDEVGGEEEEPQENDVQTTKEEINESHRIDKCERDEDLKMSLEGDGVTKLELTAVKNKEESNETKEGKGISTEDKLEDSSEESEKEIATPASRTTRLRRGSHLLNLLLMHQ